MQDVVLGVVQNDVVLGSPVALAMAVEQGLLFARLVWDWAQHIGARDLVSSGVLAHPLGEPISVLGLGLVGFAGLFALGARVVHEIEPELAIYLSTGESFGTGGLARSLGLRIEILWSIR